MTDELRELYQQVILDHNKNPKNYGKIESFNCNSQGYNPLCGDKVDIYINVKDGTVESISFEGSGCAISKASASMMTQMLKGKTVEEAQKLFQEFQKMITSEMDSTPELDKLGKLAVFAGVREFPSRVKCAGLAWHTMLTALKNDDRIASTE